MGSVGTSISLVDIKKNLAPGAQIALDKSLYWIDIARKAKTVDEFVKNVPSSFGMNVDGEFDRVYEELQNGYVYSGERRFNPKPLVDIRLFTKRDAMGLVKAGIADLNSEYKNNTVLIKIKDKYLKYKSEYEWGV